MESAAYGKAVLVISPVSKTNAATATGTLDTQGYDYLVLDVGTTTSNTASNNPSVLKIGEGDTTSAYTDVTTLVGDGTGGFTIPNAVTSGNWLCSFNLDLRKRKRHLKLSVSPVTTQTIWAQGRLLRGDESFDAAAGDVKAIVND